MKCPLLFNVFKPLYITLHPPPFVFLYPSSLFVCLRLISWWMTVSWPDLVILNPDLISFSSFTWRKDDDDDDHHPPDHHKTVKTKQNNPSIFFDMQTSQTTHNFHDDDDDDDDQQPSKPYPVIKHIRSHDSHDSQQHSIQKSPMTNIRSMSSTFRHSIRHLTSCASAR